MKAIPLVLTILLILTAASYSQFVAFSQKAALRPVFHPSETELFPGYAEKQLVFYGELKQSQNQEEEEEEIVVTGEALDESENKGGALCSYIDLGCFKEGKILPGDPAWEARVTLLARTIESLYGNEPFFAGVRETTPELAQIIAEGMARYVYEEKPRRKWGLLEVTFPEIAIHNTYVRMLDGKRKRGKDPKEGPADFLEFVTVFKKADNPVSIYLAPRETLRALFADEGVVDRLLARRKELHANDIPLEEGGQTLQLEFSASLSPDIDPSLVTYRMSKSAPKG